MVHAKAGVWMVASFVSLLDHLIRADGVARRAVRDPRKTRRSIPRNLHQSGRHGDQDLPRGPSSRPSLALVLDGIEAHEDPMGKANREKSSRPRLRKEEAARAGYSRGEPGLPSAPGVAGGGNLSAGTGLLDWLSVSVVSFPASTVTLSFQIVVSSMTATIR